MANAIRTILVPFTSVWCLTDGSTLDFPVSEWMQAAEFKYLRATVEMRCNSGNATVLLGYQVTDDQAVPGTSYDLLSGNAAYLATNNFQYPTDWDAVDTNLKGKQWVRVVIRVKKTGAPTSTQLAYVSGKVEGRSC